MNKKLLAVLALSATLIVGCSSVAKTDTIKEGAVDGLGNITESVSVKKGVIGSDNTFAHSQTYVQYGKTDDGAYAIRFATAVKGDIDVKGPVILDASAIVMGNIKSKSVQINNGAVIEGLCSQCYADVSPSSFFRD